MKSFFDPQTIRAFIAALIVAIFHLISFHPDNSLELKCFRAIEVFPHLYVLWALLRKFGIIFPDLNTPSYSDDGTLSLSEAGVHQAEESLACSPDWAQARLVAIVTAVYILAWFLMYWYRPLP